MLVWSCTGYKAKDCWQLQVVFDLFILWVKIGLLHVYKVGFFVYQLGVPSFIRVRKGIQPEKSVILKQQFSLRAHPGKKETTDWSGSQVIWLGSVHFTSSTMHAASCFVYLPSLSACPRFKVHYVIRDRHHRATKFKTTKFNSGNLSQLFTKIYTHENNPLYGILPCLCTFWQAIPTSLFIFNDFSFLFNSILGLFSLVPRPFINKKRPGNLSEFKLLTSAALELAVPIRFQNASRDSCIYGWVI